MKYVTLEDIMIKKLITIHPESSVLEAIELFDKHKLHHLPVKEKKEIIGMLSDKDVINFVNLMKLLSKEDYSLKVKEIMTVPIFAYYENVGIDQAAKAMLDNKIHAILVVSSKTEEYLGIVTYTDLLRFLANHKQYI